jgi:hypothetical protein
MSETTKKRVMENFFSRKKKDLAPLKFYQFEDTEDVPLAVAPINPSPPPSLPQAAVANPQAAVANPQAAVANPQAAVANPQAAVANPQAAVANPQAITGDSGGFRQVPTQTQEPAINYEDLQQAESFYNNAFTSSSTRAATADPRLASQLQKTQTSQMAEMSNQTWYPPDNGPVVAMQSGKFIGNVAMVGSAGALTPYGAYAAKRAGAVAKITEASTPSKIDYDPQALPPVNGLGDDKTNNTLTMRLGLDGTALGEELNNQVSSLSRYFPNKQVGKNASINAVGSNKDNLAKIDKYHKVGQALVNSDKLVRAYATDQLSKLKAEGRVMYGEDAANLSNAMNLDYSEMDYKDPESVKEFMKVLNRARNSTSSAPATGVANYMMDLFTKAQTPDIQAFVNSGGSEFSGHYSSKVSDYKTQVEKGGLAGIFYDKDGKFNDKMFDDYVRGVSKLLKVDTDGWFKVNYDTGEIEKDKDGNRLLKEDVINDIKGVLKPVFDESKFKQVETNASGSTIINNNLGTSQGRLENMSVTLSSYADQLQSMVQEPNSNIRLFGNSKYSNVLPNGDVVVFDTEKNTRVLFTKQSLTNSPGIFLDYMSPDGASNFTAQNPSRLNELSSAISSRPSLPNVNLSLIKTGSLKKYAENLSDYGSKYNVIMPSNNGGAENYTLGLANISTVKTDYVPRKDLKKDATESAIPTLVGTNGIVYVLLPKATTKAVLPTGGGTGVQENISKGTEGYEIVQMSKNIRLDNTKKYILMRFADSSLVKITVEDYLNMFKNAVDYTKAPEATRGIGERRDTKGQSSLAEGAK